MNVPAFRIWLCGTFRVERRTGTVYESVRTVDWGGSSYPRLLLKALLCRPSRQARREALMELLWSDCEPEQAAQNLNTATTKLRSVLRPAKGLESLLLTENDATMYRLPGQEQLWVDADAALCLLNQAERLDLTEEDTLTLLEEAERYFRQGPFQQDEEGQWVTGRRATIEQARYQCRLWLAEVYEQRSMPRQATATLSMVLEEDPFDEDVLCRLMTLLHRQGMTHQALRLYERSCQTFAQEGIEPGEAIKRVAAQLSTCHEKALASGSGDPLIPNCSPAIAQGILSVASEQRRDATDLLRRHIVEKALTSTGIAFLASHHPTISSDIIERLTWALSKPSDIDSKTLLYLERRIETYWQDRNDVALPLWNLLLYIVEDLQKITTLLEGPLLPTARTHLCSIAGAAAMLIGELHYDMRHYAQARSFQELAIAAAHEANNAALEAVAWARNSFAWTYDGNIHEAYNSIQQARRLGWSVNSTVRPWLAAVEAEILAHLGSREACLKALSEASQIEDDKYSKAESYWIHFDRSLFAGYQGVSFLQLSSLGHKDLVQPAQASLQDALALLDPSMKRRQATLFVDLAGTYAQQQEIEQACECALKAVNIATQINSSVSVQRLLTLRSSLESWKETHYVQRLDQALRPHLIS